MINYWHKLCSFSGGGEVVIGEHVHRNGEGLNSKTLIKTVIIVYFFNKHAGGRGGTEVRGGEPVVRLVWIPWPLHHPNMLVGKVKYFTPASTLICLTLGRHVRAVFSCHVWKGICRKAKSFCKLLWRPPKKGTAEKLKENVQNAAGRLLTGTLKTSQQS